MVVTDAVFSMDGDRRAAAGAPRAADRHDAFVMLDEAHATGVLGARGEGSLEHFGLAGRVPVLMGTLGKALGSVGGFIAGSRDLIDYLAGSARSFLFTTSLPRPAAAAARSQSLRILRAEPERVAPAVGERARAPRGLRRARSTGRARARRRSSPSSSTTTRRPGSLARRLYELGVVVQPVGAPYVPAGTSRLRVIATARTPPATSTRRSTPSQGRAGAVLTAARGRCFDHKSQINDCSGADRPGEGAACRLSTGAPPPASRPSHGGGAAERRAGPARGQGRARTSSSSAPAPSGLLRVLPRARRPVGPRARARPDLLGQLVGELGPRDDELVRAGGRTGRDRAGAPLAARTPGARSACGPASTRPSCAGCGASVHMHVRRRPSAARASCVTGSATTPRSSTGSRQRAPRLRLAPERADRALHDSAPVSRTGSRAPRRSDELGIPSLELDALPSRGSSRGSPARSSAACSTRRTRTSTRASSSPPSAGWRGRTGRGSTRACRSRGCVERTGSRPSRRRRDDQAASRRARERRLGAGARARRPAAAARRGREGLQPHLPGRAAVFERPLRLGEVRTVVSTMCGNVRVTSKLDLVGLDTRVRERRVRSSESHAYALRRAPARCLGRAHVGRPAAADSRTACRCSAARPPSGTSCSPPATATSGSALPR